MAKAKTKRKPAKPAKQPSPKRPAAKQRVAKQPATKRPAATATAKRSVAVSTRQPAAKVAATKPATKQAVTTKAVAKQPVARQPRAKTEAGGWAPTGREWGPGSHLSRGLELQRAGKLALARDAFERAVRTEDGGAFPKLQLLQVLDELQDIPAVLALVDELKGRGKTGRVNVVLSPVLSSCEARARLAQEDFAAAEVAAREAVELDANDVEAWRLVAVATAAQDRLDDALAAVDRVVALAPAWGGGHFMRGMYLHRAGRTPEAANAVARATELDRDDGDAWYNLACYRALIGEKPEALYALAAAIRIDPANAATARADGDFVGMQSDHEFARLTRASA